MSSFQAPQVVHTFVHPKFPGQSFQVGLFVGRFQFVCPEGLDFCLVVKKIPEDLDSMIYKCVFNLTTEELRENFVIHGMTN